MTLLSPRCGYPLERIAGDSGSMASWHGLFTRVAAGLGEVRSAARNVQDLPGRGAAITAARADAVSIVAALAPDIAEAETLAGVLQRYADAHDAHAQRANAMIEQIETAHANAVALAAESAEAATAAASADAADPLASARAREGVERAVADSVAAGAALAELWIEYERHYGDWDAAYDAALSELVAASGVALTLDARTLLDELLAADSAAEVSRLWEQHPHLRDELAAARPEIIGNLDGIPYEVRSDANFRVIEALYCSDLPEPARSAVNALWTEVSVNRAHLISFDLTGSEQVTAALWYGAFDADRVSLLVPGMDSHVGQIGSWGTSALDLNAQVPDAATIVWFGYDSPSKLEEPFMDRARDGAAALAGFLRGLDVVVPDAQTTVVAHSYGSTTAALAIGSEPGGWGVDQFIAVGSAGFPTDHDVLANLQSEHAPAIFATLSEDDGWARVGREQLLLSQHSTVPETMAGVTEFDSDGGVGADGGSLLATPGHSAHAGDGPGGYLMDGSESFYNIQQIIATGQPGTQRDGEGSRKGLWDFPDWVPWNSYRL